MQAGPELVHLQLLIGPHDSSPSASVNQKNTVVNRIPRDGGVSGGGSGEPLIIHNHLHMNGREIASIVSETTAKVGNRRQRHLGSIESPQLISKIRNFELNLYQ